jgi:hypothetical protein
VEEIERALKSNGYAVEDIEQALRPIKAIRYEKHRRIGLLLLAPGILLCIAGFAITYISSHSGFGFHFGLYGMTDLGASPIMGGLALLLG